MRSTLRLLIAIGAIFNLINQPIQAQDAAAKKGTLAGKVSDAKSGEDIIGATVAVEGTTQGASTDIDGKYFLKLAPGTYTIVVSYVSYKTKKLEGIEIKSGELNDINVSLSEDSQELEEIVVTGEAKKESAAGLLLQQKNAVAVSSGVSAELIKRLPDRTTADVLKRVSGATIQDGKFAIIRGMQDRYNFGMINGVPLPSSEPDRKAFSLDLIPAQVVDNMVIYKTATPDKPGEFAGGLIEITTKEVPDENSRFFNVGLQGHSITTFDKFYRSPQASSTDFLGYDDGKRQLPKFDKSLANNTNIDELVTESKKFDHVYRPRSYNALPNISLQAGLSQRLKLAKNDFGVVAMLTYNNANLYAPFQQVVARGVNIEEAQNYKRTENTPGYFYDIETYKNSVNAGGLLNFTYKVGSNHKFFFKNLLTQTSSDNTVLRKGTMQNGSAFGESASYADYNDVGYFYQSSRIFFSQFGGEHLLIPAYKVKLNYALGLNDFFNQTPDAKKTFSRSEGNTLAEVQDPLNPKLFNGFNAKGSQNTPGRFFADLNERTLSGSFDLSGQIIPWRTNVKLGGLAQTRNRKFKGTYFNYAKDLNINADLSNDIYDTITPNNISANKFYMIDATNPSDSYDASALLLAGYIMGETKITSAFRAIYGIRLESYNQKLNSQTGTFEAPEEVKIDTSWIDPLPSLNLIYALSEQTNLRASYSRTLSRPEFREFAPLAFFDFTRNSVFIGNRDLTRARIDNFDLKFEYFPKPGYTFSVNPFAKSFEKPIVYVLQPAQGYAQVSLANAKSAVVAGVEFEGRIGFPESSSPFLKNFTAFGNLALIYSRVDQSNFKTDVGGVDSTIYKTQLQGQSPYVLNLGVTYATPSDWNITLAANTYGRRISLVGTNEAFFVYEAPRIVIDASVSKSFGKNWTAKLTLGDLLAQDLILYYDFNKDGDYDKGNDEIFEQYRRGSTAAISIAYNFSK